MRNVSIFILIFILQGSLQPVFGGDKMKRLLKNVLLIEQKTVLVLPVLPDTFIMQKWKGKKSEAAKTKAYLSEIDQANRHLKQYMDKHFDFTDYEFAALPGEKPYKEWLASYDSSQYIILQFGSNCQFAHQPPKKLSNYYKAVWGFYEWNGTQSMFLSQGKAEKFSHATVAESYVVRLNEMLHKMKFKANKKGIRPKKEKKKTPVTPTKSPMDMPEVY